MKMTLIALPLLGLLTACGRGPEPLCTFNTDGITMQGFNQAACAKMSVGYNMPR